MIQFNIRENNLPFTIRHHVILVSILLIFCPFAFADDCAGGRLYQTGKASWYGRDFHGARTQSGERFNMYSFTAAHQELAPKSRSDTPVTICVRNPKNGKTVRPRVTDSGPYVDGRVLDLSLGAAREIGIDKAGVAEVEIYVYD